MALAAYRHLMRATRLAFQGDAPVLLAAQTQIRNEFRQKSSLDPADGSISDAIQHAEAVAKVLRENVVQGKRDETDASAYSE